MTIRGRAFLAASILAAPALVPVMAGGGPAGKDIVETALAAGFVKALAVAVQEGGLAETLKGDGPFTVFAPTDEAFVRLPAGTVESFPELWDCNDFVSLPGEPGATTG